jgi:hypothetical protein
MSSAKLDRVECVLRPLAVSKTCSAEAKEAVRRFNAQIEQERSKLEAARAAYGPCGSFPKELQVALAAAAVMFEVERERITRRFCFVPLSHPDS